ITRIDPPIETPPGLRAVMAAFGPGDAQHSRTHHWSQREGDQQTDQHRCSRSDSELIEEASGNARHKGHGYENNDEAESRGQYRMPDVRCRDTGGLKGYEFPLFHESECGFEYARVILD